TEAAQLDPEAVAALTGSAARAWKGRQPLRLYFQGPDATRKRQAAQLTARSVGARLLFVDLLQALNAGQNVHQTLKLIFREAWLQGAVAYLDELDALRSDERAAPFHALLELLGEDTGITILSGGQPWAPARRRVYGVLTVHFE